MSHQTQRWSYQRRSSQTISWLSTEKLKQTTKANCIHNGIHYNKIVPKKTKARFGRLPRPPAWKWNGSILEGEDIDSQEVNV